MKLLVVDREGASRRMVVSALGACGHDVTESETGSVALELLARGHYDGIVTEIDIGEINGLELLRRARSDPRYKKLGIILVTYPMDIEELRGAIADGLTGYISKPVDLETVAYQVESLIRRGILGDDESMSWMEEVSLSDVVSLGDDDRTGEALLGEVIEHKYLVEELIGEGGMGIVYRVRHLYLERPVALKVLPQGPEKGPGMLQRFVREARILARIRSKHIVDIHDFGFTSARSPYLVMELLEGLDLRQLLHRDGQLPLDAVIEIALQVSEGLAAAHDSDVLHLDFKPSNVMLCGEPSTLPAPPVVVKLLDFGIARFLEEAVDETIEETVDDPVHLTGTAAYMSPEQCRGDTLDPKTDLYSLGAVIFQMLTGRPPFEAGTREELMHHHINSRPPSPCVFRPDTPLFLEDLVLQLLAKEPAERVASADVLLDQLAANAVGSPYRTLSEDGERSTEEVLDATVQELAEGGLKEVMETTLIEDVPSTSDDDEGTET